MADFESSTGNPTMQEGVGEPVTTERDLVPTLTELTEIDSEFKNVSPNTYEKFSFGLEENLKLVPTNRYQHNGFKLHPTVTAYAPYEENGEIKIENKGHLGVAGQNTLTEDERKIVQDLADKYKQFAFHQREI